MKSSESISCFFQKGFPPLLTPINKMFISVVMIITFADTETESFFATGKARRLPPDIQKRAAMRLNQLDAATVLEDLRMPPSNHLESLHGDRKGKYSIRINDQWRLCFQFKDGDAYAVEIVDYH